MNKKYLILALIMLATYNASASAFQLPTWPTAALYWVGVMIYWQGRLLSND